MNYLPFNSVGSDRRYKAEDWAWYFSTFLSNGVFALPDGGLQVVENDGMTVSVNAGFGFYEGYAFRNPSAHDLTLSTADGSNPRIDRVVLRWDLDNRLMELDLLEGTAAASPTAPELTRTSSVYEFALADITVAAGATSISQSAITDQRTDTDLCGYVTGTVEEVDFSQFTAQFQAYYAEFVAGNEAEFADWFDHMKDQLSEDAAGNLQLQIDALAEATTKPIVVVPLLKNTAYTYTGEQVALEYQYLDTDNVTITAPTAINVGTYTVTASLADPTEMRWNDGTTADIDQTVTIEKADDIPAADPIEGTLIPEKTLSVATATGVASVVSSDTSVIDVTSISGNTVVLAVYSTGTATLTVTTNGDSNHNAATGTVSVNITTYISDTSFANCSDADLATLIQMADEGEIDLYDDLGWRVGDERAVSLSAISKTGTSGDVTWTVGEDQAAQSVTLVLMNKGGVDLVDSVLDTEGNERTECSFVVGLKNCLTTNGYMNSSNTNSGSWPSSARRPWCNGGFRDAIPEAIRGIFKKFKCVTATEYNASTVTTTEDYFALPAAKEIFGSASYSNSTEAAALSQFTYYATSSNRVKKNGDSGSACGWWERSPIASSATVFCGVSAGGGAYHGNASLASGLAPFGCL